MPYCAETIISHCMEDKKRLYPIKFIPVRQQHHWGTETVMIADLGIVDSEAENGWLAGNTISDIMETYIERIVGEDVYNYYGRQFPVSVSVIEVDGQMPVSSHPDDEAAGQRYDALGKNTFWYILEASDDAAIHLGFKSQMSAAEFYGRCLDGSIGDALSSFRPAAGDWLNIRPGTVYSASGKLKILAVTESSAITFTLYDPKGSPEESHAEDAIDLIDFRAEDGSSYHRHDTGTRSGTLLSSQEFTVGRTEIHEPVKVTSGHSFTVYSCVSGGLSIQVPARDGNGSGMANYPLAAGETVLVPADIDEFFLVPTDRDTVVIETVIEKREEVDSYINPDTEPFLEGEDYEGVEDEEVDDRGDDDVPADGSASREETDKAANIRRFFN